MADFNKVILMGRLTADPELRNLASGQAVTQLRLATSKKWVSKDGEKKEETLYIDVNVWGRPAENCAQYLRKGSPVHVDGYLKLEKWTAKDGTAQSRVRVEADSVQFLDSPKAKDDSAPRQQTAPSAPAATKPAVKPAAKSRPAPVDNPADEDDDIPF